MVMTVMMSLGARCRCLRRGIGLELRQRRLRATHTARLQRRAQIGKVRTESAAGGTAALSKLNNIRVGLLSLRNIIRLKRRSDCVEVLLDLAFQVREEDRRRAGPRRDSCDRRRNTSLPSYRQK